MRKLATIQKIVNIKPIEGADKIEVAQVLGWHVVVKKGDFNKMTFVYIVKLIVSYRKVLNLSFYGTGSLELELFD